MRPAAKLLSWSAFFILILPFLLIFLYKTSVIREDFFIAVISGAVISLLNFIFGIISIKIGDKKPPDAFMKTILGGTALRLFLMLVLILLGLKILELSPNSFIFSVLFFYVFFLIIEIFYLNLRKI
jgi:F0F1-type ATP synthase assembly protein I